MSDVTSDEVPELLRLGPRITVLPVIHGSGQFALSVRRWMLDHPFDCVAVPLPESFRAEVEAAVLELPRPTIVIQASPVNFETQPDEEDWGSTPWDASDDGPADEFETNDDVVDGDEDVGDDDDDDDDDWDDAPLSYVPVDPCQPVIMAIRAAMGEHIPRAYIDLETDPFRPYSTIMPDPFAVRRVSLDRFAAAVLPSITRPPDDQTRQRILHMAWRLKNLETRHERILVVVSVLYWPWIREAYNELTSRSGIEVQGLGESEAENRLELPTHDEVLTPRRYGIEPRTLAFFFGELPSITSLYERARSDLVEDDDVQIDGVKELLIAARISYQAELGNRARRVTPLLLSKCLQYIRNLSLIHRRMTPDLVTIVTAAKQILGDPFALHVAEQANRYAYPSSPEHDDLPMITLGIDQGRMPDGDTVSLVSRLPGPPMAWRTLKLQPRPAEKDRQRWQYGWNPYGQCSYPPEDEKIENFRTRVLDRAKAILGNDLAKTEKFTTSVKDGIDIRDTLRHWYERQIYVKVVPPSRGTLDTCVMLFDSPSDPREYPWRTTWFAEHQNESTLAFYATNFGQQMVGPGIGLAIYGGAMFLYPPIMIPDIWNDARLDFTETLEERLIAAACLHSRAREIAVMSSLPPGSGWQRLARRHKKHLVHVPMTSFSDEQVQQLRMVHVLNGSQVRSYAASFIRKA